MPAATIQHTTTIDAPRERVWDGLQDPNVWTSIGPVQKVWDPQFEDGVLTGFQWSTEIGGVVYEGTGSAAVRERPGRYQLVLDTSEVAGTITVNLRDGNPGGTEVEVTVEIRSKGLLSSMFFPVVRRAIDDSLPEQVDAIADRLSA